MALAATLVDAKNRQCQAPEVASLKPGGPPVDARADVYAFGSLAHVVAAGAPPRNGLASRRPRRAAASPRGGPAPPPKPVARRRPGPWQPAARIPG